MEYKVKRFIEILKEENKKQNLVSRKSLAEEIDKHVEDSLQANQLMDISGKRLVDIGSGAGFPGLILAISRPDCQVTLVESDRKKAQFLNNVAAKLQLSNVAVVPERAEILGHQEGFREQFQLCTSRAVAALNVLLELSLPLLTVGGQAVIWKGRNYQQEIDEAQHALQTLGGVLVKQHDYTLMQERDRILLVVKKTTPTPARYPRRPGIPAKRPL
ncbi:MAG TPA: 16S rRNA (guanine(527)-N(7))-methyltransferase RsmG [Syntrophomonas sp.]|jgi:16S rRNA (guanine527-N7)-methyltransferase|nr:16S rRNA (guanine(527)-N(7))-methyltransferase RsmG [Syntrophomonas sp.]